MLTSEKNTATLTTISRMEDRINSLYMYLHSPFATPDSADMEKVVRHFLPPCQPSVCNKSGEV